MEVFVPKWLRDELTYAANRLDMKRNELVIEMLKAALAARQQN